MDKLIHRNVAGCHAAVGKLRRSQHARHLVQGLLDGEVVRQGKTHGARGGGQNHSRQRVRTMHHVHVSNVGRRPTYRNFIRFAIAVVLGWVVAITGITLARGSLWRCIGRGTQHREIIACTDGHHMIMASPGL